MENFENLETEIKLTTLIDRGNNACTIKDTCILFGPDHCGTTFLCAIEAKRYDEKVA